MSRAFQGSEIEDQECPLAADAARTGYPMLNGSKIVYTNAGWGGGGVAMYLTWDTVTQVEGMRPEALFEQGVGQAPDEG